MRPSGNNRINYSAKNVVLIAVMSATISAGKFALSFLPNIEIVTLLCAVYGYTYGARGVAATVVFVLCEMLIFGLGTWVVAYLVYWPLVSVIFCLLFKLKVKNLIIIISTAILLTIFFGLLTALIDIGLLAGAYDHFWQRFSIYYIRGITFYLVHIYSNLASFLLLFAPLSSKLMDYKQKSEHRNLL